MNISPPVLRIPKTGRVLDHLRARRSELSITPSTVGNVLNAFGLEQAGAAHNLAHGWRNSMVMVKTSEGPVVVKRYLEGWSEATVVHEHSLIEELTRQDFPSIRLVHKDGLSYRVLDGYSYMVSHYVPGYNAASIFISDTKRAAMISQSGSLLARFHDTLAGFTPSGHHHAQTAPGWFDLSDLATERGELQLSPRSIGEQVLSLDETLSDSVSRCIVHADFGLHNILLRRASPAVLHDFELAREEYRLVDIAIAIARLPARMVPFFLDAYRDASTVSDAEWKLFPLIWERHWLAAALRSWQSHLLSGDQTRLTTARSRITTAQCDPASKGFVR